MIIDAFLFFGFLFSGIQMLRHLKAENSWYSLDAYVALYDGEKLDASGKIYRLLFFVFVLLNIVTFIF